MKIIYIGAEVGFEALKAASNERVDVEHIPSQTQEVADALKNATALLDASMKTRITDEMIDNAPKLKIISCATTGADHIERRSLDRRGIEVRTLKEDRDLTINLTPAAELSWALVMACARKIPAALEHVRGGEWVREEFPGVMLRGKTIGLIGCGRIGSWMARYAGAFEMNVIGYDPFVDPFPENIKQRPIKNLMTESDVISVHVPLGEETRGLVNGELFESVKKGAIFINTSRGAIADEAAMLRALQSGRLKAVGLDVLDGEPDIDSHPLVQYARENDNLIITPHCGGFSPDAVALVCRRAAEKIIICLGVDS